MGYKFMRLLLLILGCLFFGGLTAQKKLSGKILIAGTNIPVPSASIFLSNTSVGTVSKEDGSFSIENFPEGRYDLVVTMLGYSTYIVEINAVRLPDFLTVQLQPKAKELQEVIVEGYEKNGWKKWGDFFMQSLIGKTPNAQQCILLNKEVVRFRFSKKLNRLTAISDEPLLIRNKALGYELKYDLTAFEYNFNTQIFYYQGFPLFTEIESSSKRRNKNWERNRQETFQGSLLHFMRSLYRNQLVQDGFELRKIIRKKEPNTRIILNGVHPLTDVNMLVNIPLTGDSIAFAIDSVTAGLQFSDYLQVVYLHKKMPEQYRLQTRGVSADQPITAELHMPNATKVIAVLANGSFFMGRDLLAMAYWAWSEKLSNLLPLDYKSSTPKM
ncbi:MAG: hypothetical protein EAZ35_08730 [Sphingobacteriia bacterium]|nr:MAG: hypothetical protein EAZ41_10285 [Sphingobacteriia bacterium]TAG30048.1 MAG: hypothetical protein EAZ35_08730 [Sphingobacteriia bacterium]